ncbi:serine threonine-protein kinase bud32 [Diplodia corticola]|uniref:EKC/KEOPS complex subunit BUD32 n=1 Tax=Diplodia corticola TaxID=236234 RepID=A0A1J9RKV4_9PEZI|nr:serine threonine-protein kinase bud32 [Diplodia corticola]OJD33219.1 serine threonine-protein kinase bud32 [Diplodia corticola]
MATVGTHDLPRLFAPPPPPPSSSPDAADPSSSSTSTASPPPPPYEAPQIITQGAEALVYRTAFLAPSRPAILKHRPAKPYRHPTLDRRLTKQRILAEARTLVRLRREGVAVPGVLACDWDAGWLLMEFIPGHTIRACLDRYLHAAAIASTTTTTTTTTGAEQRLPSAVDQGGREGIGAAAAAAAASATDAGDFQEGKDSVIDEDAVPELWDLMTRVGRAVGRMHSVGVVHGDLTTSNLMLRTASASAAEVADAQPEKALEGTVTIIDFGLAGATLQDEDKAVDLYVLERAFGSTHPAAEPLFREVLRAYGDSYKGAKVVLKRLEDVRMRGRKRSMLG